MSTTQAPEADAPVLQDKFATLEMQLNQELVERDVEIEGAMFALVSGTTLYMLGKPGTAKSLLPARLMSYITGADYFDVLMTRTSQPEELFGPLSLAALEDDRFEHSIEGYLPTANIAMIDEIFKSNSSVLNALLWAINERKYRHGRDIIRIPLRTMFCASNELPQDDSLNALYDRLILRYYVEPVRDAASFAKVLTGKRPLNPEPILAWEEIEQAQLAAADVEIPARVIEVLTELRHDLKEKGIEPSERRFVEGLKIIRAAAWLDQCEVADTDHIAPFEHILWEVEAQRGEVSAQVGKFANPLDTEATALLESILALDRSIDEVSNEDERMRLGNEIHAKLIRAGDEYDALAERAGIGKRRGRKVAKVRATLSRVTNRALLEIFQFSRDEIEKVKKEKGLI